MPSGERTGTVNPGAGAGTPGGMDPYRGDPVWRTQGSGPEPRRASAAYATALDRRSAGQGGPTQDIHAGGAHQQTHWKSQQGAVPAACDRASHAPVAPGLIVPSTGRCRRLSASESTFYRLPKAHGQGHRRGRAQSPRPRTPPTSYRATMANKVWSWHITYLPTGSPDSSTTLSVVPDIFSRKLSAGRSTNRSVVNTLPG